MHLKSTEEQIRDGAVQTLKLPDPSPEALRRYAAYYVEWAERIEAGRGIQAVCGIEAGKIVVVREK